jgi:hypothetical protein
LSPIPKFRTPEITRNIVMRPANGSAIVFQTQKTSGAPSAAARAASAPVVVTPANG